MTPHTPTPSSGLPHAAHSQPSPLTTVSLRGRSWNRHLRLNPNQRLMRGWAVRLTGLAGGLLGVAIALLPVQAEPVPARDGTGTVVNQRGDRFDIEGGQRSGDGANLFHSFEQFGLSRDQIANFLADPEIRNILSRVVGGDASVIDGLLRVSGGEANLFLLNPAGVIFGPNARLDVPASFTTTTATGIGLEGGWFSAVGDNDYASLVGTPNAFAFGTVQPGSIVNAGNLSVTEGHSLTLLGGTVVNTGELNAPGGEILIAAVPGESLVRLSQAGHLLSLEVEPLDTNLSSQVEWSMPVASLPELLTGGNLGHATRLQVNPDGSVTLTGSDARIPDRPGIVAIAGTVNAATDSPESRGGNVAIAGGEIGLLEANINASGPDGGGTVLIGGDVQGQGPFPTSDRTYISSGSTIAANALTLGDGGQVVAWADGETVFYGSIEAQGAGTGGDGGFVEVSGLESLNFRGDVDLSAAEGQVGTLLLDPTDIVIRAGVADGNDLDGLDDSFAGSPSGTVGQVQGSDTAPSILFESELEGVTGNILLQATRNITIDPLSDGALDLQGGDVTFTADSNNDGVGAFFMDPGDTILTNGGDLTITAASILTGDLDTSFGGEYSGYDSGNLSLTARGNITTGNLITANTDFGDAGSVEVISQRGVVQTGYINASSAYYGNGGDVTVQGDRIRITGTTTTGDSILTSGGIFAEGSVEDGTIFIRHAGGPNNNPFVLGNSSVNGAQGSLNRGASVLSTGSFAVLPGGGTAPGTPTGITIASVNTRPSLSGPTLLSGEQNQSISISISDFLPSDVNADNTQLTIDSIAPGATLTRNGVPVTPGTVVLATDTLVYTPPDEATGNLAVFTISANDRVSTSDPVEVRVALSPPDPVDPDPGDPDPGDPDPGDPDPGPGDLDPELDDPETFDQDINGNEPNTPSIGDTPYAGVSDSSPVLDTYLSSIEYEFVQDFTNYLGLPAQPEVVTADEAQDIARIIEEATGEKPAFVYVNFVPESLDVLPGDRTPRDSDQLELVVITSRGGMVRRRVPDATREKVLAATNQFRRELTSPIRSDRHQAVSQQLYSWLITPILEELQLREITNLSFLADTGLRSLPYAALYNGETYLVEQFSVGLMPSLSLTDTQYVDIRDVEMLAMGVSESTQGQEPLPAVPVELSTLVFDVWRGSLYLNESATLENLKEIREQVPFGIIHMATHADFKDGPIQDSYIQLWNERLQMDQVRQLGWNDPPVEMLVLSACRTALGSEEAELGFAGLAVQTGVKSAVASLWYVSDTATTALMAEFYDILNVAPIKSEALRRAQIAMIRGEIYIEDGKLYGPGILQGIQLPEGSQTNLDLAHPYYWSGFTIVGNPW